jgi:hypothetical protein
MNLGMVCEMWEFISSIGASLLTELIATVIVLPVATYLVVKTAQHSRAARMWGVSNRFLQIFQARPFPTIVISTSELREGKDGYSRPATGIGQVRALTLFAGTLPRAYRARLEADRVLFSVGCDLTQTEFTHDLVIIGGPKTNSVGKVLLEEHLSGSLPAGLSFREEGTHSGDDTASTFKLRFEGEVQEPAHQNEAIGMVIRAPNPLFPENHLTFVAGLGTYGTEAAARALTELKALHRPGFFSFRWFKWMVQRRPHGYVAIIRARLNGNVQNESPRVTSRPEIVKKYVIPRISKATDT